MRVKSYVEKRKEEEEDQSDLQTFGLREDGKLPAA